MDLIIPTISQGLLWSLLAIGVYITFRVLDIADLTVEGSFPLGAAVAAACMLGGMNPVLAIFVAAFAGMLAGVVTGFLCTKLKIPALLDSYHDCPIFRKSSRNGQGKFVPVTGGYCFYHVFYS